MEPIKEIKYHPHDYIFEGFNFSSLTLPVILAHSTEMPDTGASHFYNIHPEIIEIGYAVFTNNGTKHIFPKVVVQNNGDALLLSCECNTPKKKLCDHQAQVLHNILARPELRIFFDTALRQEKIKVRAREYGLENEADPGRHFELEYNNRHVTILPRLKALLPVSEAGNKYFTENLLPLQANTTSVHHHKNVLVKTVLVFSQHKYYKHLQVELYMAHAGKEGKIKSPLTLIDPLEPVWKSANVEEVKFYTAIATFQNNYTKTISAAGVKALAAIVNNPLSLDAFYHNTHISENITPLSLKQVQLKSLEIDCNLQVNLNNNLYGISGHLVINDKAYAMNALFIKYGYFILAGDTLHLMGDMDIIRVISFFSKHHNTVIIHQSKFEEFRKNILSVLENKIRINYAWLVPANKEQLEETGFDQPVEKLVYLTDSGNQVLITPVMRYGDIEVSVLSKKQLYARDKKGNAFSIERDDVAELEFTALLLKQHPDFFDQLHMQYFYLTKKQLLDDCWFLDVFEEWHNHNITIYGFSEITNNKLNAHKGKVTVKVSSGVDWFDTDLQVRFGKQKVSLKQLHKSVKHRSRFVQLDDGTQGILPVEWVEKFAAYFEAGDVADESIRTPRINFAAINELYEQDMLTAEVKEQLISYSVQFNNFDSIQTVVVPAELKANLRGYQQQGLNWLNFLDDFGFGGCLADDMGLGKTIQVIAFILLLRSKRQHNTHLVVVPTSLIFNWQEEVEKFAPSLKMLTLYGNNRIKNHHAFDSYDIVLTSYGMLLSDIHFLKTYHFNYIFLDESQAIKNPDSQRYKAARMLRSANKIVMTGTPIENNSFDLFGQLSFACPGLLGNQQYFKDLYSTPIDKFSDSKRAAELQKKIHPFILRRTKRQVAPELPDKTEMIIYCEMGTEQRKVYDAYENEFRNYLLHKPEEDLPRESMNVLQGLTKLRQICNSPALLNDSAFYGDGAAKIEALVEQIESKHHQHKILIFSQFVSMLELIRNELNLKNIPFEWLTGQTKDRAAAVNSFQNNETVRVFLISLKAGGTGLNLTEADYVYLVDPWWNPAVENQAIDRSYRIGQKKNVVAVRLICPGTIEEKIMKLQASKNELANDLVKTDKLVLKNLSKNDLLALVTH